MSITDFFRGKVLLITGGTAFLGQPMVAKILTALPEVERFIFSSEAAPIKQENQPPRKSA